MDTDKKLVDTRHVDVSIVNENFATEVSLNRSSSRPTEDQSLWVAIRNRTSAIGFNRYHQFIDDLLCREIGFDKASDVEHFGSPSIEDRRNELKGRSAIHGVDAYNLLKLATEAFLILECGLVQNDNDKDKDKNDSYRINENQESNRIGRPVTQAEIEGSLLDYLGRDSSPKLLPYIRRIVTQIVGVDDKRRAEKLPYCEAVLQGRLSCPSMLELIWSYWHEEGMLVQTMNTIAMRFQNKRMHGHDPLVNLELDPLRPLNNIMWGYIQDEYSRLSVQRRAYEYDHHYGFRLVGKAITQFDSADRRTKFVEAFHNLLYRTAMFYREDDDTTVISDAFSLLNMLREVHLILAEGAHNQFGDLPWAARGEMLQMQWILARPEIKEFLRGRHMVPYQEPWMGAVDDMKRLQGWSDSTVTHFHELAQFGEQILLSIRYGDWIDVNDQAQARNWARYWRPEIQRYIHAYQATTGVDLSADVVDTRRAEKRFLEPSIHLNTRLAAQRPRTAISHQPATSEFSSYRSDERNRVKVIPAPRKKLLTRKRDE